MCLLVYNYSTLHGCRTKVRKQVKQLVREIATCSTHQLVYLSAVCTVWAAFLKCLPFLSLNMSTQMSVWLFYKHETKLV